jgi:acyl-coenzyme A thioesterase PaaI-like protein
MLSGVDIEELNAIIRRYEFTRRYGFEVVAAGDGTCEMLVPYMKENDRPGGIVIGQVYMHAADVAFWMAVVSRMGMAESYVTSSMTTAFLGAARAHPFRCHARIIKSGRRVVYGEAECRAGDRVLTHHTLTYMNIHPESSLR